MRRGARLLLALLVTACGEAPPAALTVGPVSFTQEDLLGLSDARRETLAELAAFGLAVADSTTAALGAPLVIDGIDQRLLEILAAELTLEEHGVGDEVLEARYRTDPAWELTVQHILVFSERWRTSSHREAAAAKAARAHELLLGGTGFEAVETALASEPGGEARQGVLPPGREGAWVPEFWRAASALEPGELSPVTETQYGYHVLRLQDRRSVPFPEARTVVAREVAASLARPGAALDAWMAEQEGEDAAREAQARAEARERGLEVPEAERAELLRVWEDQTASWAIALGFRYGLTAEQVGAAALAALATPGQAADIARSELGRHADLLWARYTRGPPGTP